MKFFKKKSKWTEARNHDIEVQPGGYILHFSTCWCKQLCPCGYGDECHIWCGNAHSLNHSKPNCPPKWNITINSELKTITCHNCLKLVPYEGSNAAKDLIKASKAHYRKDLEKYFED